MYFPLYEITLVLNYDRLNAISFTGSNLCDVVDECTTKDSSSSESY